MTRLYTIALFILSLTTTAQSSYPKPDDNIPEAGKVMVPFTFYNIEHPSKSKVTLDDYKGKWLFLSFWYRGCTTCLYSLSKVNDLQQRFKNQIHFLMVGVNAKESGGPGIRSLYERLRKQMNLQLTVAYDSIWKRRWGIYSYPHIIIVDPSGMVRTITNGQDMTYQKISDLLNGKDVSFQQKEFLRPEFNPALTSLSNDSLLFRSQLSQWNGEQQYVPEVYVSANEKAGIRVARINLEGLYTLAFLGKSQWSQTDSLYLEVYPYPVWEVKDETIKVFDYETGKGIYNYDLVMPSPKTRDEIMTVMQQELYNTFGFEASLEERWMPIWKLTASNGAAEKLKTKGGAPGYTLDVKADGGAGGIGFRNYPMIALLNVLIRFAPVARIPYVDETNIAHNIDLEMNVLMMDQEVVKRELKKHGLDLILGKRLMKVVVIKDKKLNN